MRVFLFPGQGTQKVGMGKDLREHYPDVVEPLWKQANQILNYPLKELCLAGPVEVLRQMPNTQPAVFMCSYAAYTTASHLGAKAEMMTGHSLGEYSALAAAEVLPWQDVLKIVQYRGRLMHQMQQIVDGKMAAVLGGQLGEIEEYCTQVMAVHGGIVEVANHNELRQIVVSGHSSAVDALLELLSGEEHIRTAVLRVGGAAHSSLLERAVSVFSRYLKRFSFKAPTADLISGSTGQSYVSGADISRQLSEQLVRRVEWVAVMAEMERRGVSRTWEFGPGKVLTGLVQRGFPGMPTFRSNEIAAFVEGADNW